MTYFNELFMFFAAVWGMVFVLTFSINVVRDLTK